MRGVLHGQVVEQGLDIGAQGEDAVVEDADRLARVGDPEVRVGDRGLQGPELRFRPVLRPRVLHRQEAVVDVLGDHASRRGRVHQPAGHVDLAHRAARPCDDLGGEHVANPELLAEPDQQRVDPRGIGVGQLGEVADPHQHLGRGVALANAHVPVERGREAGGDRLEDRIHDVGTADAVEVGDVPIERLQALPEVRDHDHGAVQVLGQLQVDAVHAQHVVDPGPVAGEDLILVEGVDADREPARLQPLDHLGRVGELLVERAAEVDDVGAARLEVFRLPEDLLPREVRDVVDLGEDADVVATVLLTERGAPEVLGQLPEVRRTLLGPHPEPILDHAQVPFAQAGNEDLLHSVPGRQVLGDPRGGHEGRHGDGKLGDFVGERGRHGLQGGPESGRGEPAGHENGLGHSVVFAIRTVRGRGSGSSLRRVKPACPDFPRAPTCSAFPPAPSRVQASTPPSPRSSWPARSPAP